MIGLVRNEWKKVFLPVLLTTVLLAIAMGVLSCTIYQNYVLHYDLEAWEVGTELFSLLYPLFVVVPLCWNLYYERKNNFLLYVMPRVKIKKYLTAKWIAYALGTLCIIVIPYILSAVFALYVKPPVVPFVENPFSHIFENAFIKTPLLIGPLHPVTIFFCIFFFSNNSILALASCSDDRLKRSLSIKLRFLCHYSFTPFKNSSINAL